MLVLALQFSRSDDRRMRSTKALDAAALSKGFDSLKTEEKTVVAEGCRRGRRTSTSTDAGDDPPVHQLGCPNAG